MNASNELAQSDAGAGTPQLASDLEASAGFSSLEKSRQVLVFQTMQEAISSVPPRLEATFPRVVAAYTTLSDVVEAAANGQLSDDHLARLESDVEAAGGVIAPGLWSQGDNSIAAFRAATFGALKRNFRPPVMEAACAALNARLQTLKLNDLGRVFQVVASFFSPLTPSTSNTARLQAFDALDTDRQVLVFRTIQDAILASPPRTDASFSAVVSAFQAEVELLTLAGDGQLSDEALARLEASIEAAGGVLAPGTYAQGKQSVASFRAETFKALQPLLPPDVLASAVLALNARLRDLRPTSLPVLFKAVHNFFLPLLAQGWNSPTLQMFKSLDPSRQSLVFRTIETAISSRPDLESTIFSSAVKAIGSEQSVIHAASAGSLSLPLLQNLQTAIEDCGGVVAPGLRSTGEGSVGEFVDTCFTALTRDMPPEVCQAAFSALNAKLRTVAINSFGDVVAVTRGFMDPLRTAMQLAPAQPATSRTETLPPAEPNLIEEVTLVPPLERELPDDPQAFMATGTTRATAGSATAAQPSAAEVVPDSIAPIAVDQEPAKKNPNGAVM
ncbi:MAG: hypothetical protein RLZZ219_354 [Cyanobacteriota bacterium]